MKTQPQKLNSLERRVGKLTLSEQISVANKIKKHALILVKKCLNGKVCEIFDNFFEIRTHETKNPREIMVSCWGSFSAY